MILKMLLLVLFATGCSSTQVQKEQMGDLSSVYYVSEMSDSFKDRNKKLFEETLAGWDQVESCDTQVVYRQAFAPEGQTLKKWDQLFTFSFFGLGEKKLFGSAILYNDEIVKSHPDCKIETTVLDESPDDVTSQMVFTLPNKSTPIYSIHRFVNKCGTIIHLEYSCQMDGTVSDEVREKWIEIIKNINVQPKVAVLFIG